MIDTWAHSLDNSKLKSVMNNVVVTGGAPFGGVTYYNFNYPNATHMLLVGEDMDNFQVTMPSNYSYYELSWAATSSFRIDGASQSALDSSTGGHYFNYVQLTSFLPDVTHIVDPSYFGALVVIYRMP